MFNFVAGVIWFTLKRKQSRVRRKHGTVGIFGKGPTTLKNAHKYKESTLCNSNKILHSQQYMSFRSAVLSRPMPSLILNNLSKTISGPPGLVPRPSLLTGSTVDSLQRRLSSRSVDSVSVYSTASAPLELHQGSAPATIQIPTTQMTPFPPLAGWPGKTSFRVGLAHWKAGDLGRGNIYDPAITFERAEPSLGKKLRKNMLSSLITAPPVLRHSIDASPSLISRETSPTPTRSAAQQICLPLSPTLSHLPSPYSPPQKYNYC